MTSREIAELTGKNHADVMRDIRNMLQQLGMNPEALAAAGFLATAPFPGPNNSTRLGVIYRLPYRECMILVTGYSIPMRAKVVDSLSAVLRSVLGACPMPLGTRTG